jgi:hypothetical protein
MSVRKKQSDTARLDRVISEARRAREDREKSYREQALKLYPWVCGRCGREFMRDNLHELTVHHRDHNHDNNPPDGSNWELLCLYCHDNEHARYLDSAGAFKAKKNMRNKLFSGYKPFADLGNLLKDKKKSN